MITATPDRRERISEPHRPISQRSGDDRPRARERPLTNEEPVFDGVDERHAQQVTAERATAAAREHGIDPSILAHGDQDRRRRGWPRRPWIEPGRHERGLMLHDTETARAPGMEP